MIEKIEIKTLEDVKIGDEFVIDVFSRHVNLELVTCTKITPKQAIIGGDKYRKKDACFICTRLIYNGYKVPNTLYKATNELKDEIIRQKRLQYIRNADFIKLNKEQVKIIYNVLNEKNPRELKMTLKTL
jgi:hypothetical protein